MQFKIVHTYGQSLKCT